MVMSDRHVMIDLETLSTRSTAAITSIGAYVFDPRGWDGDGPDAERMFHMNAHPRDSLDNGLHVDGDTLYWWLQQSDAARAALCDPEPLGLAEVLLYLGRYIGTSDPDGVVIWSHAGFDFPILDNAYDVLGIPKPYWYRSPRDLRTIIHAAYGENLDVDEVEPDFPANPVPHHAGYDAWHQAVQVQQCFRQLGRQGGEQ